MIARPFGLLCGQQVGTRRGWCDLSGVPINGTKLKACGELEEFNNDQL